MKQGSGDDPFADLDDEDDGEDEIEESDAESAASESVDSAAEPPGSNAETATGGDSGTNTDSSTKERYIDSSAEGVADATAETDDSDGETSETVGTSADVGEASVGTAADVGDDSGQTKAEADGIPWVLRRSRVKEDRGNVHQFFLREEYSAREDEIIEAVAGELDMRQKDLQKLDVREAMVAAADPEDIAAVLREWGYEYLK